LVKCKKVPGFARGDRDNFFFFEVGHHDTGDAQRAHYTSVLG